MDDEQHSSFPRVSRSGRILKKSAKWLEAENSLEEENMFLLSHLKSRSFKSTSHQPYEKNKKSKRFDSRPGSIHSTSVSSNDGCGTSSSESMSSEYDCSPSSDLSLPFQSDEKVENVLSFRERDHKYCVQLVQTARKPVEADVSTKFPKTTPCSDIVEKGVGTRESNILRHQKKLSAMYRHLPLQEITEKVGEAWRALPQKERHFWICNLEQLSLRNHIPSIGSSAAVAAAEAGTLVIFCPVPEVPECDDSLKKNMKKTDHELGITPVDAAAHLKLLGDSLTGIAQKILAAGRDPSASGAYSVLLDSLLCSMAALLCLSRKIHGLEHVPGDSLKKTLDHIAYFLPGL